jgi:hypothetical protein
LTASALDLKQRAEAGQHAVAQQVAETVDYLRLGGVQFGGQVGERMLGQGHTALQAIDQTRVVGVDAVRQGRQGGKGNEVHDPGGIGKEAVALRVNRIRSAFCA